MHKSECNVHKIVFGPQEQTYSVEEAENWLALQEKSLLVICHNCNHLLRKRIGEAERAAIRINDSLQSR